MRKKSALIALVILALGLLGTGLSTLHKQSEYLQVDVTTRTFKVSYGFPFGWHGYSVIEDFSFWKTNRYEIYWFSLASFLQDAVFWIAVSTLGYFVITIPIDVLHKIRASKNLSVINIRS